MRFISPANSPYSPWHVGLVLLAFLLFGWAITTHSRTPMSVGLIGLSAFSIFRVEDRGFPVRAWAGLPAALTRYLRRPDYALPAILLVAYVASLAWSGDRAYAFDRLRYALQAWAIPCLFFVLAPIFRRWREPLTWALILFGVVGAIGVGAYAMTNAEALIAALGQGRAVPSPVGHVHFSAYCAFAGTLAFYRLFKPEASGGSRLFGGLAFFILATSLHLVAVRTGLVMLYVGLVVVAFRLSLKRVSPPLATVVTGTLLLLGIVVARQVPSVARKIDYTLYSLGRFGETDMVSLSDGGRVLSLRAGIAAVRDQPMLGASRVGIGRYVREWYDDHGLPDAHHLPTTQFIFSWAHAGLLGLLGSLACVFGALATRTWWRTPLLLEFVLMTALWCLVETPFESASGGGLALLMIYLTKVGPEGNVA